MEALSGMEMTGPELNKLQACHIIDPELWSAIGKAVDEAYYCGRADLKDEALALCSARRHAPGVVVEKAVRDLEVVKKGSRADGDS